MEDKYKIDPKLFVPNPHTKLVIGEINGTPLYMFHEEKFGGVSYTVRANGTKCSAVP